MKELLRHISDEWFLAEPLLFDTLCSHELVENLDLKVEMRVGKGRIEYNTEKLSNRSEGYIAKRLRIEVVRILLRHPYQRQPLNHRPFCLAIASDMTIAEYYDANETMATRTMMKLPPNRSFEEYYSMVDALIPPQNSSSKEEKKTQRGGLEQGETSQKKQGVNGGAGERSPEGGRAKGSVRDGANGSASGESEGLSSSTTASSSEGEPSQKHDAARELQMHAEEWEERSALWEEDELQNETIEKLIEKARNTKTWGTLSRELQQLLETSIFAKVNIRRQLAQFRTGILSNKVVLSRMKPSRRYGFMQMGIRLPYTTRLLIGVDVSGSIANDDIQNFLSVINHFFTQGIEHIEVVQFDSELRLPVQEMFRVRKSIKVMARGGTNFDPLIRYFEEHTEYDGLIIFTDGYAPLPQVRTRRKLLWILSSLAAYKRFEGAPKLYIRA